MPSLGVCLEALPLFDGEGGRVISGSAYSYDRRVQGCL